MKIINQNISLKQVVAFWLMLCFCQISCKKFVDIPGPKGKQDLNDAFNTDGSATAVVLDIYQNYEPIMQNSNACTGLAADEMASDIAEFSQFMNNEITPVEPKYNASLMWATFYSEIHRCNLVIEGINKSPSLSEAVRNQLLGEVLFFRAYMFFNLVNVYGGVPLTLSSDALLNSKLSRSTTDQVWNQIFTDLLQAKSLLKPEYPSEMRARVNQYAISALLARAYLYHKDWEKAETEASTVISSGVYSLSSPNLTFKNSSNETILQLYTQTGISSIAALYVPENPATTPSVYLRSGFIQAFEKNGLQDDLRKTNWTALNAGGIPYINKYKIPGGSGDEYTILLRLGEIYLIRAEARAFQNNLNGLNSAESDLNKIRNRAGLGELSKLGKTATLKAVEQERRVELFGEYMHRWFDLKRSPGFTNPSKSRADELLSVLKGSFWKAEDALFPIPGDQVIKNTALVQNPGY